MIRPLFVAGAALCLAVVSDAQVTVKNGLYDFKVKFVKGKKYTFVNSVDAAGGIKFDMPIQLNVLSVSPTRVEVETKTGPGRLNGTEMGGTAVTEKAVLDPRGKTVSGGSAGGQNVFGSLPAKPIRPGSTWSGKAPIGENQLGLKDVTATYKFVGVESVSGKKVARIDLTIKGSGEAKMSGQGKIYISVADGLLESSVVKMALTMQGSNQPMSFSAKTVRSG